MNADAAKWLADYDKIIDFTSLGLTGKEFVLAYDINNPAMYEKLVRSSKSILIVDDEDFFARWQRKLDVDADLKKDVPTLVVCHTVAETIKELGKKVSGRVVGLVVDGRPDEFCKEFAEEWKRRDMKKFDLAIMNPPYAGKGDPLFMKISKVIYDFISDSGRLVSINPTSVVDNTYDTVSAEHKKKYGDMRVLDFVYRPEFRLAFDASIGTGICVTRFSKLGKYDLWSDFVREKRFGKKNWDMRKNIVVEKVNAGLGDGNVSKGETPTKSIAALPGFKKWTKSVKDTNENSSEEAKCAWKEYMERFEEFRHSFDGKRIVVLSYNRGHVAAVGEHKWYWVTLQSDDYLKVQREIPNISQFDVPFDNKETALNFIKWLHTDFVMYIVNHYKTQMTNNLILFKLLPQPPSLDGNYSDEVLMKHFNLTQEEMDWIHSEMNDFGWKVNLGKTEEQLMEYIDEINR